MTAATKALTYRIGADIGDLRRKMEETTTLTAAQRREFAKLEKQQREHRKAVTDLGVGMVGFGTAVALGLGVAAKAAIDWESAFTGVRKTVDGSEAEMAQLEGELRQLARTLPTTHREIAGVAEAAGQLGIKRQDIAAFTKVMIDLGNTTNLTAEEAATDLAKFSNIMGTSAKDVDRLGSALVALGNDGASTEKDILQMALRIAGAGKQIKLTEAQVLGIASALSSVGIEAEAGGSSISTVMIKISEAVSGGAGELDAFAKVAGMSGEAFASKFRTDAAGAITAFIAGLGEMQRTGKNVFGVLDELGLSEIRVRDALLRAGSASELFTKSLEVGSSAWAANTALTEEANKRYETSASKIAVAGNQIKDTLIDIGAAVAPVVADITGGIANVVRGFQELPGPVKDVVTWVGLAAAGIGLLGGAALVAGPKIMAFRESMTLMAASGGAGSKALAGFGKFLVGPWGLALGGAVTILGIFAAKSGAAAAAQERLKQEAREIADAISEQNGQIDSNVRKIAAKKAADEGLLQLAEKLGINGGKVVEAILNEGDAYKEVNQVLLDRIFALQESADAGSFLDGEGKAVMDAANKLKGLNEETRNQVDANNKAKTATKETTSAAEAQAEAHKKSAEKIKQENDALDALVDALNKVNGIELTYRESQRAYVEQLNETAEVLKKNGKGLDINTEKGRENARALDDQAKAAGELAEAAAREAQKLGGAAAGAAAMQASLEASRPALIKQAEAFGLSHDQAVAYADAVLAILQPDPTVLKVKDEQALAQLQNVKDKIAGVPPNKTVNVGVLSAEAIKKLEELGFKVEKLPNGTINVTAQTATAQTQLNNFIEANQGLTIRARIEINTAAVAKEVRMLQRIPSAYGNIVHFASGGISENHRPMIARAYPGTVRVWAEPDTGGESYIPWAMDRRPGATDVLRTTANGFGFDLVPRSQAVGAAMASGRAAAGPGLGGGTHITIEHLTVQAYSDGFSLQQVMNDIAMSGAR